MTSENPFRYFPSGTGEKWGSGWGGAEQARLVCRAELGNRAQGPDPQLPERVRLNPGAGSGLGGAMLPPGGPASGARPSSSVDRY